MIILISLQELCFNTKCVTCSVVEKAYKLKYDVDMQLIPELIGVFISV